MIFLSMKRSFLFILLSLWGITVGCVGGSSAPGAPAAPGGPPTALDSTNQGPLQAATPPIGSQTTDQGHGTGGKILVYVTPPQLDGNDGSMALQDPSSTFSGEKPRVYSSQSDESGSTDGGGEILIPCIVYNNPIMGESSSTEIYATYKDSEKSYKSDTVTVDCTAIPSSPVLLALRAVRTQRDK